MKFTNKKVAHSLITLLKEHEIKDIILSPGSRNAPLTVGFSNDSIFNLYSIIDERSAAYIALGMSQQTKKPSVVCCTSGSALLNYYPAVSEAYYQNIPMIVISADRPKSLVNQADGQTIQQEKVLNLHCALSIQLTEDESKEGLWYNQRLINKAILTAYEKQKPVHINIPFTEPLYETVTDINYPILKRNRTLISKQLELDNIERLANIWNQSTKKMILIGSLPLDCLLEAQIQKLTNDSSVILFTENTSNLVNNEMINTIDRCIFSLTDEDLKQIQPELLITLGRNLISKKIKQFLRKYVPKNHWHIDLDEAPDTFQCLTDEIQVEPKLFFSQLFWQTKNIDSNYADTVREINHKNFKKHKEFLTQLPYSDLKVFEQIFEHLPNEQLVHFSNSSIIRYAQLFQNKKRWKVYCNRGTSGIDGSTSTAIGAALKSKIPTTIITGDISFLYDSNGLWNNYLPNNFKIILLNNGGGSIFKFIPGPSESGVLETLFETKHKKNIAPIAEMYNLEYTKVNTLKDLNKSLTNLWNSNNKPQLLEIDTMEVDNADWLKKYFQFLGK